MEMAPLRLCLVALVLVSAQVLAAPVAQDSDVTAVKAAQTQPADTTVEQLEQLKSLSDGARVTQHSQPSEDHHHAAAGAEGVPPAAPHDAHDATTSPETTTKVFHGAGRLIQAGLGSNVPVTHTAVRRSFNAHLTKETNNNMDHYSSYAGVQYSPLDMAEYVLWTGDERAVTTAVEQFLQEGIMSKEEAILFLQEIKFNLDYLRAHYAAPSMQQSQPQPPVLTTSAEEEQQHLRRMLVEQAANEYQRSGALQGFPFGSSPDIIKSISSNSWQLSNTLTPYIDLPVSSDLRPEPMKRSFDPMLQTNILSTSDYDRDGPGSSTGAGTIVSEEEYEQMMDKLKAADSLYTQYTLEEIIYQLSKMMFSQTLSRQPTAARAATQRFMAFLEAEADRGQLSRTIEKKVLDIMVAALTDTVGDHPELMQARDNYYGPKQPNRMMRQYVDTRPAEPAVGPSVARAILAAYKDELLKGLPQRKRNNYY